MHLINANKEENLAMYLYVCTDMRYLFCATENCDTLSLLDNNTKLNI